MDGRRAAAERQLRRIETPQIRVGATAPDRRLIGASRAIGMSGAGTQVAAAAGAQGAEIDQVADRMAAEKLVRIDRAEALLKEIRSGKS